jgi:16S rRNA (cytidine1402-2'-O)-methyltransferase
LPRRRGERRRLLSALADQPRTIVALESPHRLLATLSDLLAVLGDRRIALCRELTKLHEEVFRARISEAIAHFREPRGEFTLVLAGASQPTEPVVPTEAVLAELRQLRQQGMAPRQAVTQVAQQFGLPRRQVYRLWLQLS